MVKIFSTTLDKTFIDVDKFLFNVAEYFARCKWMHFLDEKFLQNVICWTNLDNIGK
jgi:hypothetical protein